MNIKIKKLLVILFAIVVLFASGAQTVLADEVTFDVSRSAYVGDSINLANAVSDEYKNCSLVASSSNDEVATISDGKIFAAKVGEAYIVIECYSVQDEETAGETRIAVFNVELKVNAKQSEPSVDYSDVLPYCKSIAKLAASQSNVKRCVYGRSVMDKPLEAYEIYNASKNNKYEKTLFIDFAVHGFEDEYYRDGKVLVKEAVRLVRYFADNSSVLKNFRLVIVVCANPDGTFDGKNNSRANSRAFGRCTAKHVDINRDFRSFRGKETRTLKNYILKCDPDVYLNCHGWENQVIGSRKLNKIVKNNLKVRRTQNEVYCYNRGFAIGWVHKKLGIPVALVEYKNTSSVSTSKDAKMIKDIVKAYK